MSDKITYNFCIESLRYAYNIIGYDAIVKELNYIHYLYSSNKQDSPNQHLNKIEHIDKLDNIDASEEVNEVINPSENKNIIIQQTKTKYVRSPISDDERCETVLSTGKRCTLRRSDNCNNCGRHSK